MKKTIIAVALMLFAYGCGQIQPETELSKITKVINTACDEYNFSYQWALTIMWSEHSGIKNVNQACSHNRTAYGPGGLLYRTAKYDLGFTGVESDLNDYNISVPLCIKFLAMLKHAYHGDMHKVVNHYISGNPNLKHYDYYYKKMLKIMCEMGETF